MEIDEHENALIKISVEIKTLIEASECKDMDTKYVRETGQLAKQNVTRASKKRVHQVEKTRTKASSSSANDFKSSGQSVGESAGGSTFSQAATE